MTNASLAFMPLALADKELFDRSFKEHPPLNSEFTFTNLFCWRGSKGHEFALFEGHLVVAASKARDAFYSPIGPDPAGTMVRIAEALPGAVFVRVERSIAESLGGRLPSERDRADDDYVYSLSDLRDLSGGKYVAKRNFVKRCEEAYSPEVIPLDHSHVEELIELQDEWCRMRGCDGNAPLKAENDAIIEALRNFEALGLSGVAVVIKAKMVAFAIGERLSPDTFVEHFEKASGDYVGIYQYLLRAFARAVPSGFEFLNREQDLGIEGLRKAKESYGPVRMVEKLTVRA